MLNLKNVKSIEVQKDLVNAYQACVHNFKKQLKYDLRLVNEDFPNLKILPTDTNECYDLVNNTIYISNQTVSLLNNLYKKQVQQNITSDELELIKYIEFQILTLIAQRVLHIYFNNKAPKLPKFKSSLDVIPGMTDREKFVITFCHMCYNHSASANEDASKYLESKFREDNCIKHFV